MEETLVDPNAHALEALELEIQQTMEADAYRLECGGESRQAGACEDGAYRLEASLDGARVLLVFHQPPPPGAEQSVQHLVEKLELQRELQDCRLKLARAQEQTFHLNKLAALGQVAAGVAHEIMTPLQVLSFTLETLAPDSNEASKKKLERADKSLRRIDAIVSRLLSNVRNTRAPRQRVDLDDLVRESLDLIGQVLQKQDLSLRLELRGPCWVHVNVYEIQQILTNLLLNARDAMQPCERKEILVRTGVEGSRAFLEVEDSGPGLSPEMRGKVFEAFFTTKPVGKGTGLGLSVSYELARTHGGNMLAQNPKTLSGACFRVTLPLTTAEGETLLTLPS